MRLEFISDLLFYRRKTNIIILVLLVIYSSFYLYVSGCTRLDITDRAQDYYNAMALSKGEIINLDFHTPIPGIVFFESIFFKVFPNITYIGLRIIGLLYLLFTIFVIYVLLSKLCLTLNLKLERIFLLNLIICLIPFYIYTGSIDLHYNTMPILFLAGIFLLIYQKNSVFSHIFVGMFIGYLILLKITFLLFIPIFIIYYFFDNGKKPKKLNLMLSLLIGIIFPLLCYAVYLFMSNALVSTFRIYYLLYTQQGFENKSFILLRNFFGILPGVFFILFTFKLFFKRKLNWLFLLITWICYAVFLRYTSNFLIENFTIAYLVGSFYGGVLLFMYTEFKDKALKHTMMLFFVIFVFVYPLGSRTIYSPLIFPSILIIPLISVLLIHLKRKKILILAVLPFLLSVLALQSKGRLFDFTKAHLINKNGQYSMYSEHKLKYIYDPKFRVNEIDTVSQKIRSYLPEKSYFLLYPRFSIYYWLVENAIPAIPKIDLENTYSLAWIKYNIDYMIEHEHIPQYVFAEREFENHVWFAPVNGFIKQNYTFIEKFNRYNVYALNKKTNLIRK